MCLHLRSISCAIVYKTRCVRVNLHSRMSGGFVAGVLYTEMRDVKTTQDNMKNQLQIDHDKVTQQLQTVTWQLDRVTQRLDRQYLYMHVWFTVFLGIMVFMMMCMASLLKHGHYSRSSWTNVTSATDDVYRETAQGNMFTVSFFTGMLSSFLGWFIVGISPE